MAIGRIRRCGVAGREAAARRGGERAGREQVNKRGASEWGKRKKCRTLILRSCRSLVLSLSKGILPLVPRSSLLFPSRWAPIFWLRPAARRAGRSTWRCCACLRRWHRRRRRRRRLPRPAFNLLRSAAPCSRSFSSSQSGASPPMRPMTLTRGARRT